MIHASAEFDHSASDVFEAIADITEHAEWQRGVESIDILAGNGRDVGTRFGVKVSESGFDLDLEGAVVEHNRPTHLRHVLQGDQASLDIQVEVVDLGGRSRLEYRAEIQIRSFALKMMRSLIESKLEEKAAADMKSLAHHLEKRADRG